MKPTSSLKLVKEIPNYTKFEVETDCLLAVKLIKRDNTQFHPLRAIIKEYKYLLEVNKAIIIFILLGLKVGEWELDERNVKGK